MKIVLVEDDVLLAEALVSALQRNEFTVRWVNCGEALKAVFATESPDILILDLGLPDIDGLELLSWVRKKGYTAPLSNPATLSSMASLAVRINTGAV